MTKTGRSRGLDRVFAVTEYITCSVANGGRDCGGRSSIKVCSFITPHDGSATIFTEADSGARASSGRYCRRTMLITSINIMPASTQHGYDHGIFPRRFHGGVGRTFLALEPMEQRGDT